MDIKGSVALVTGGNGGLGQRICHALAKEGVHIAVCTHKAATRRRTSRAS
jgi:NAD(P)-dependent dehydrogenase (short-subunit alcohol dehydrogenase family)